MKIPFKLRISLVLIILALLVLPSLAQESTPEATEPANVEPTPAEITNDEGGIEQVVGTIPVSNPSIRIFIDTPLVVFEDQAGFVDRDLTYAFPPESQTLGYFASDWYDAEDTTVEYGLTLPIEPQGGLRDVDHDGTDETGVQVFAVALWGNRYGDLTIDRYDIGGYGGWSGSDATTVTSENPETLGEYTGGKIIVWSPDAEQGFPSGFGDDGLLFTEDDPIVIIPAGYTMVDMDTDPFTFDRSRVVTMDTYESEDTIPDDFSDLSYTDAFEALLEIGRNEYAYTDLKNVDWDALEAEFLPRIQEAEDNEDADAFLFAMYDFSRSIPDGHIGFGSASNTILEDTEQALIDGGIGLSLRELTDGDILVNYIVADGAADQAGIEVGAQITSINGMPLEEAIAAVDSVNKPYSISALERLDQIRFVTRFPLDTEVEIAYRNPSDTEDTTVTLTAVAERDSLQFSRQFVYGQAVATPVQPVSWEFLPGDYGYISVTTFDIEEDVLVSNVENFIQTANAFGAPGIILDLRNNGGGFSAFANRLASYFFSDEIQVGYSEAYNRDIDAFYYDPDFPELLLPPTDPTTIWEGPLVVLVSPACASACEGFAYYFVLQDRAAFVGQYPSNGIIGGRYFDIALPEDSSISLPTIRDIDLDGNPIIEGIGIVPTVPVPVTEENMSISLSEQDIVLDAAIAYLDELSAVQTSDGGEIAVGDSVEGEIAERQRVRYTLTVEEETTLDFVVSDPTGELDTVLRVYVEGNDEPVLENDDIEAGNVNSGLLRQTVPAGLTIILEVGGFEDAEGGAFTLTVSESPAIELSVTEAGEIALGASASGELAVGERARYTLTLTEAAVVNITLGDGENALDSYLRVYAEDETLIAENDDIDPGVEINSLIEALELEAGTYIIEVGTYDDGAEGAYTLMIEAGE